MPNQKPIRLPPLDVLRVRYPNKPEANPCLVVMSQVLSCWASAGYNSAGCAAFEDALRTCMDKPRAPPKKHNDINHHLGRFNTRLTQRASKKK